MKTISWPICFLATALAAGAQAATPPVTVPAPALEDVQALAEAVQWIRATDRVVAQYNYSMSVRIRPLLFWISREEVGGGYIRRLDSPADPRLRAIEVLFGSDPARAKGVNRWGSGSEVWRLEDPDRL